MSNRNELEKRPEKRNPDIIRRENITVGFISMPSPIPFPYNIDEMITDLQIQLKEKTTSKNSAADYLLAATSGLISGAVDSLMIGKIDLENGKGVQVLEKAIMKMAALLGCKSKDLIICLQFLIRNMQFAVENFGIHASRANQSYRINLSRSLSLLGLICSILSQFTGEVYEVDGSGYLYCRNLDQKEKQLCGKTAEQKNFIGTLEWILTLSSHIAETSGGVDTGIPGPILSMAKQLASIPFLQGKMLDQKQISLLVERLLNGVCPIQNNNPEVKENLIHQFSRQTFSIVLKESMVRALYSIRVFISELQKKKPKNFESVLKMNWSEILHQSHRDFSNLMIVADAVFTTVDIADALIKSKENKQFICYINILNVGDLFIHAGQCFGIYTDIRKLETAISTLKDERDYFGIPTKQLMAAGISNSWGGIKVYLTPEEMRILYSLESFKIQEDIRRTNNIVPGNKDKELKNEWFDQWRHYINKGFKFLTHSDEKMVWYSRDELIDKIRERNPELPWFNYLIRELMYFRPYFSIVDRIDKEGQLEVSNKFLNLYRMCNVSTLDNFFDPFFNESNFWSPGIVSIFRNREERIKTEIDQKVQFQFGFGLDAIRPVGWLGLAVFLGGPLAFILNSVGSAASKILATDQSKEGVSGDLSDIIGGSSFLGNGLSNEAAKVLSDPSVKNSIYIWNQNLTRKEANSQLAETFSLYSAYLNDSLSKDLIKQSVRRSAEKWENDFREQIETLKKQKEDQKLDKKAVKELDQLIRNLEKNIEYRNRITEVFLKYSF